MANNKNPWSRTPYGYKRDENDKLIQIPEEIKALAMAKELYYKGNSLKTTTEWLVKKTGRSITPMGLKGILGLNRIPHRSGAKKNEDVKKLYRRAFLEIESNDTKVELDEFRRKEMIVRRELSKKRAALKQIDRILDPGVNNESTIVTEQQLDYIPEEVKEDILTQDTNVVFRPNPGPQTQFLAATEKEVFYGGSRGGAKTYSLLVDPLRYCNLENARALLIRKTMPELRDIINHTHRLYPKAFPGAKWREQEKEWRFPSGARIEFGYAENVQDAMRYVGQAYTWIGVDELPHWPTNEVWNLLKGSLRSVDVRIPTFLRATGNPGAIGSIWVKEEFIDPAPPNTTFHVPVDPKNPNSELITRRFIPAKLQDNPYLTQTTEYKNMLLSLPEIKRRQWLEGDWTAFEGSAFPDFRSDVHICDPFEIPPTWQRFRACDWGYATYFCVLWFAIDYNHKLYVYREFYGKGLPADQFAQRVHNMEEGENIQYGVMDSSVWSRRGDIGPSIVETMRMNGCYWRPSDRSPNSRLAGKAELHRRLALKKNELDEEVPSIFFFRNCRNIIRTLPLLPLDENNPEDVDTDMEDHAYDALRYGIMSRPMSPARYDYFYQQVAKERWQPASKVGY